MLTAILLLSFAGCQDSGEDTAQFTPDADGGYTDADGDGYDASVDCDDLDPDVHGDRIWYLDSDLDGFGGEAVLGGCEAPDGQHIAAGGDCDDSDAGVYPGATDLCDGVDQDCDGGEVGLAHFESASGAVTELSEVLAAGTSTSPVSLTLDEPGSLLLCEGTFYANLQIDADVSVVGLGADTTGARQDTTTLHGGSAGTVISAGAVSLQVADLAITGGSRSSGGGGGLALSGTQVTLEGLDIYGNFARAGGGGLYLEDGADVTLARSRVEENSTYGNGGGLRVQASSLSVSETGISGNSANNYGGGLSVTSGEVTLDAASAVSGNAASVGGGGVAANNSGVSLAGAVSDNSGGSAGGGVWLGSGADLALSGAELSGNAGWGLFIVGGSVAASESRWSENTDGDVYHQGADADYTWGDEPITFTCDGSGCGVDRDGDGYLSSAWGGTDCDDDDGEIHPGAAELCDAVDRDCDGASTVEGLFFVAREDGAVTDLSAGFDFSDAASPAALTLSTDGTLGFCQEGTFYVTVSVEGASVRILGLSQELTTLDAGGAGSVVVGSDWAELSLSQLALTGGTGTDVYNGWTRGGAIYTTFGSLSLEDVTLTGNTAEEGGGLYLSSTDLAVSGGVLSSNSATYGGGVFLTGGDMELRDTVISANEAAEFAGGIYLEYGDATLSGVELSDNAAGDDGAGAYLYLSSALIEESAVSGNAASGTGGGLFMTYGDLELLSTQLTGNTASSAGGLYLGGSEGAVSGALFSENVTSSTGGGLYVYNSRLSMDASEISLNTAQRGGGMALYAGPECALSEVVFTLNEASYQGGALFLSNDSAVRLSDAVLSLNTASSQGGAVYAQETAITLDSSSLSSNYAGRGGALYLYYSSSAAMTDSEFLDNISVDHQGGAIALASSEADADRVDFSGNQFDDLYHVDTSTSYTWGLDASFRCDTGGCE